MTCGGRETVTVESMNPTAEDACLYKGRHVAVASPDLEVAEESNLSQTYQRAGHVKRLRTEGASK